MNFKFLCTFLLACIFITATAQQITVSGVITDAKDGSPMTGVNVIVKGTTKGAISDIDGKYTISAPSGTSLIFSFVGYKSQEVTVNAANVNVALEPDVTGLEEIVVIGYGTVKKSDATGSVAVVSSKDFNKGAITSPQDLIVGKSAGVVITNSGGAPGSGSTIRVRGGSSLNASNDPLIIIDGVPISNQNASGSSNFLSFINPNDIETFTVLKDASATAIYGSRASNGVILITTKKGKEGSPMRFNYDASTSLSTPIQLVDVYSGDELREMAATIPAFKGADTSKLGNENTDWQKEIYRNGISHDHNLSLSGSIKTLPYRVSVGYTDQNGILKNTDMQRTTGAISLDPSLFNNTLKVNFNVKGMYTKNNFGDDGAIGSAINMDPTQPVKDGDTTSNGYFQWQNYGAGLGTANPVEQLLEADNRSNVQRLISNVQFNYKLPFLTDLQANLNLATDYTKSEGHNNRPVTSPSVLTNPTVGRTSTYDGEYKNNLLDFYLFYSKDIEAIRSRVEATAGYSWQHFERDENSYRLGVPDSIQKRISESYLVSFFGRLNYTLMDRYLITFTLRQDGSSRFAEDNRWGLFPSAAFAWKIKEEEFLKNIDAISDFKLRLGWGVTGQQDILGNDYPSQARYIISSEGSYYFIDGKFIPTLRPNAYDPDIKWEETTTKNIGLDLGFFKGRMTASLDFYMRVTNDLINTVQIPSGSNFKNVLTTNVGSLENKGVELSLNLIPISKKDVSLNLGFNITYNKNEITKLLMSDDPSYVGVLHGDAFTGEKQVTRVGHPAFSFFVNKQVYDQNDNPIEGLYVDLSGKGGTVNGINDNKYIFKNPAPDFLLGFSANFSYKNLDASFSSRASIGNYVYNQVAAGNSYDQMFQIGYWRNAPKFQDDNKFVKRQFTSDYFVNNASFFKLDNASIGYRFDNIYKQTNLRLSFTVQNLLTISNYEGIDPEVRYTRINDADVPGIDNNFYPRPRVFLLGLSLNF